VLVADGQAQVYTTRGNFGLMVVGCAYGHRSSSMLGLFPECGSAGGCAGVEQETLAGPIIAYGAFSAPEPDPGSGEGKGSFLVVVRDLRSGKVLLITPTGTPGGTPTPGRVGVGRAVAIVLKSDGAVAWIAEKEAGSSGGGYEVHAADRAGIRLLAAGAGIEPSSLALGGSTLYWTQAGGPASASLS
jgi:hypothetical protein